jgi:hypothetical protein
MSFRMTVAVAARYYLGHELRHQFASVLRWQVGLRESALSPGTGRILVRRRAHVHIIRVRFPGSWTSHG